MRNSARGSHALQRIWGGLRARSQLLSNFSYMTLLESVVLLFPLLLYPYLTRVLGKYTYGWVIMAQVFAGYFTKFVDFGFRSVSARWISAYREHKPILGRILGSVLLFRLFLWCAALVVFSIIIFSVNRFRVHWLLFLMAYLQTFEILLYPQFFFQGIEKMKYISIIGIGTRTLAALSILFFVHSAGDDYIVPLSSGVAAVIAGVVSLVIIRCVERVNFLHFSPRVLRLLLVDAWTSFITDMVTLVKDKFNYFIVAASLGVEEVVIYDLGLKFLTLLTKPAGIITTVLFPRVARGREHRLIWQGAVIVQAVTLLSFVSVVIFLPWIANFFVPGITNIFEVGLFSSYALLLALTSYFYYCSMIAFGYVKQIFYSILYTTGAYLVALGLFYWIGLLQSIVWLVVLAGVGYFTEFIYSSFFTLRHMPFKREYLRF